MRNPTQSQNTPIENGSQVSLFLSPDELRELTGCVKPSAQARYLEGIGIKVFVNALNKVVVSREAFIRWQLGGMVANDAAAKEPKLRPIK